jgi:hypothetical protein
MPPCSPALALLLLQEPDPADQPAAKRRRRNSRTAAKAATLVAAAQLPGELLASVLQHVEQPQRLGACSFVSRAWRDAAAAATTSLAAVVRGPGSMQCLSSWLARHSLQPCGLSLAGVSTVARQRVALPCSSCSWSSCRLLGAAAAAAAVWRRVQR